MPTVLRWHDYAVEGATQNDNKKRKLAQRVSNPLKFI